MIIVAVAVCSIVLGGPSLPSRDVSGHLARHIVRVNRKARPYAAKLLADRIVWESDHYGIPVELMAAIAYSESYYQDSVIGTSGETGLWQILPDKDWRKMDRASQYRLGRDIVLSTARAAALVAYWGRYCGSMVASCLCHYNSGYRACRPSYRYNLRRRAAAIRSIIYGATPNPSSASPPH